MIDFNKHKQQQYDKHMLEGYNQNKYYTPEEESVQPWATFQSHQSSAINTPLSVSKVQNVQQSIEENTRIFIKQNKRSFRANKSIGDLSILRHDKYPANTPSSKYVSLQPTIYRKIKENLQKKQKTINFSLYNEAMRPVELPNLTKQIIFPKNDRAHKSFLEKLAHAEQYMDFCRHPIRISVLQPKFRQNIMGKDMKSNTDIVECRRIKNQKCIKSSFSEALHLKKQYSSNASHGLYRKRTKKLAKKSFLIQKIMLQRNSLSSLNLAFILQQKEWKQDRQQMVSLINRQKVKERQLKQ